MRMKGWGQSGNNFRIGGEVDWEKEDDGQHNPSNPLGAGSSGAELGRRSQGQGSMQGL